MCSALLRTDLHKSPPKKTILSAKANNEMSFISLNTKPISVHKKDALFR